MDLQKQDVVVWTDLAQDRDKGQDFVNTVMWLRVAYTVGDLVPS